MKRLWPSKFITESWPPWSSGGELCYDHDIWTSDEKLNCYYKLRCEHDLWRRVMSDAWRPWLYCPHNARQWAASTIVWPMRTSRILCAGLFSAGKHSLTKRRWAWRLLEESQFSTFHLSIYLLKNKQNTQQKQKRWWVQPEFRNRSAEGGYGLLERYADTYFISWFSDKSSSSTSVCLVLHSY